MEAVNLANFGHEAEWMKREKRILLPLMSAEFLMCTLISEVWSSV